ncbi:30S ribosomal protein S17 [Methanonatronarchaeum sp. AMET6-2]|uniref:30S ribosomal protein S17 n=1 Tax=Methanonatronarchaeum sp. AMET6-2 TaxID=2933293 RepID=UPI001227661B|nr:30S ribosomal protein S17 [Methanonatronarchaeum sp. AMET6-2]RZN60216.1 MAG: 30S ribosomal protein S17 [Methanonatronarchaeia archaeon]UOY10710.1 30S ribosomal protein S17 [Methanonatronarchaeum sp. AMET6-2]
MTARDIGLDVKSPEKECEDENCPFHGKLPVRGQVMEGKVVSLVDDKSAVIQREYKKEVPKYERYEKRKSTTTVHRPQCIDIQVGDNVKAAECRPLSKTKSFVVVERGEGD